MLIAVSRDVVLAGLFGARHTLYVRNAVSMRYACICTARATVRRAQNHDAKLTRPFLRVRVGRGWLARLCLWRQLCIGVWPTRS